MEKVQDKIQIMKTLFFLFFISTFVMACKKENIKEQYKITEMKNDTIKQILEKQIKSGAAEEYGSYDDYGKGDLDALVEVENNILIQKGYKTPNDEEFMKRVETIFKRKIDNSSSTEYLRLDVNNKCNKELQYNPYTADNQDLYISKKNKFITNFYPIPVVVDYLKLFPELQNLEKDPIEVESDGENLKVTRWKDIPDLSQVRYQNELALTSRNKYLFNDSKADLVWLLANDKEFLKKLVIVFGYDKEDKINKLVVDDLYRSYTKPNQLWYAAKIGEVFFTKDCQNKLQVQEGLLSYVSQSTTKDDDKLIYALTTYLDYLFKEDQNNIFNESPSKKFTLDEKAKIIAYVANIESPLFYKYKPLNSASAWHNAGTSLYNITNAHPEILKIIEQNNYYGLQPLKGVLESVEFEEESTNHSEN